MATTCHLIVNDLEIAIHNLLVSHIILRNSISVIENQSDLDFTTSTKFHEIHTALQHHIRLFRQRTHLYECTTSVLQLLHGMASRMTHVGIKLFPLADRLDSFPPKTVIYHQQLQQFHTLLIDLQRNAISHNPYDFSTFWKMARVQKSLKAFTEHPLEQENRRLNTLQNIFSQDSHYRVIHKFLTQWENKLHEFNQKIADSIIIHLPETLHKRCRLHQGFSVNTEIGTIVLSMKFNMDFYTQQMSTWQDNLKVTLADQEQHLQHVRQFLQQQSDETLETAALQILTNHADNFFNALKKIQRHIAIVAASIEQLRGGFDKLLSIQQPEHSAFFKQEIRRSIIYWDRIQRLARTGLTFASQAITCDQSTPIESMTDM